MQLKPGLRLESATCDTQVVVVKAPGRDDVDVRCGGDADARARAPAATAADRRRRASRRSLGKRYADEDLGLELLCTQGGDGSLSVGDQPLLVKGAKPLPSSD